jgi:hypothetical protein
LCLIALFVSISFLRFNMPVHTSANRPRRPGYSFATQGAATAANTSSGSMGKHVLKRVPGVDLWGPAWGEETVIRVYPAINKEDHSFEPYRYDSSYCNFSDWIRVYDAVRNFGNPGVTMLLHNGMNNSYDVQAMNPCWILYRAINQALSQGQGLSDWVPLTKGGTGKSAQLSKPTKLYLVQCAIFRHKSQNTFGANKPPIGANPDGGPTIVMALPATAGESMIRQLEEKDEDWQGDPDSADQYKYGDLVGVTSGRFVHIYELGKDPRNRYGSSGKQALTTASIYSSAPAGATSGGRSFGGGAGSMEPKGYGTFITETLDGGEHDIPASLEGFEDMVRSKVKPWDDILEFKSDEEQAHLIAPLFPASAVLYAWRDRPQWIPESVREAGNYEARKPVSASIPPSALNPGAHSWGTANRPAPNRGTATWGSSPQPMDSVVPQDVIPDSITEDAGNDPMLQEDNQTIIASRAKLQAAIDAKRSKSK